MSSNRIAASFVYTLDGNEPIRNGFVEYSEDGTVTAEFFDKMIRDYEYPEAGDE